MASSLQKARSPLRFLRAHFTSCPLRRRPFPRRDLSSKPDIQPAGDGPVAAAAEATTRSRAERTISRLPRFLQGYARPLYNAPITHITSFLVLHELTAVVPLFGLAGAFHYWNWLPPFFSEGKWVHNGMEKFGNYFRKKGWLGEEGKGRWKWWGRGEGSVRIVVEFATAYAVVKALLPLRLMLSVWATPWFARTTTIPIGRWFRRIVTRRKDSKEGAAAAGSAGVKGSTSSNAVAAAGGGGGGVGTTTSARKRT